MTTEATPPAADENHLIAERRQKLEVLRGEGIAYPNDFRREHLAADLHARYGAHDAPWFESNPTPVSVAGRVMSRRIMGKASFVTLSDSSGRIQLFLQSTALGAAYESFKGWDIGD